MKARNIMLLLILNYLLIIIFSAFVEFLFIDIKAQNLQLMIRTAGDMALEQVQATDDFFKPGEGYMLSEQGVPNVQYTIQVPFNGGSGYKKVPAFEVITGRNTKEDIFEYLYIKDNMNRSRLQEYLSKNPKVLDIEVSGAYWDENFASYYGSDAIQWYKIPKIAQMGYQATGHSAFRGFNQSGIPVPTQFLQGFWQMYDLNESKKLAYESNGSIHEYYMTPISLGITYIDEELLSYYFMNNMDLLMRSKYVINGIDLNSEEGGDGVYKGNIYSSLVFDDMDIFNPINNGYFTLLRGEEKIDPNTGAKLYLGVRPDIRYKVIDMFDSRNDEVLSFLFGAFPNVGGSKSAYFRQISEDVYDPMTGLPYTSKPIVIAEVTFYADVIIHYDTIGLRELRGKSDNSGELSGRFLFDFDFDTAREKNYIDIVRVGTTNRNGGMGNPSDLVMYRTLFAVAP